MNEIENQGFDPLGFWLAERMVPGAWENLTPEQQVALAGLARAELGFPVLEARNRDALDFREVSVLSLRDALARAFLAGTGRHPS
jgi:hypothetical protein